MLLPVELSAKIGNEKGLVGPTETVTPERLVTLKQQGIFFFGKKGNSQLCLYQVEATYFPCEPFFKFLLD